MNAKNLDYFFKGLNSRNNDSYKIVNLDYLDEYINFRLFVLKA